MTILCHLGKITNYKCQCGKTLANKNIKEGLMKKFLKFGAALTALVLGLACFAACSNGNDDGGSSNNGGNVSNNGDGNTNNGGGNSNEEEEKPRVTIVAEYQDEDLDPYFYRFYSDYTYEYEGQARVTEKGTYDSYPTKKGKVAMIVKEAWNKDVGKLLPSSGTYVITIDKDGDDLYFIDDMGLKYVKN